MSLALRVGTGLGRRSSPRVKAAAVGTARKFMTVGMGCGIPLLSLALSSIGGRLLSEGHKALGAGSLSLCCAVLAVSLSHLAWAVKDITASARWQAWCLAGAIDVSLANTTAVSPPSSGPAGCNEHAAGLRPCRAVRQDPHAFWDTWCAWGRDRRSGGVLLLPFMKDFHPCPRSRPTSPPC
jgi:hypothetical protein